MFIYALCKDTLQCRNLKNYELKECERGGRGRFETLARKTLEGLGKATKHFA